MLRRAGALVGIASFVVFMAACSQSDVGITTAVKTKFVADTKVSALDVHVDTTNHVVTLTGAVKSAAEKAEAYRVAKKTAGVHQVVNKLTIAPKK